MNDALCKFSTTADGEDNEQELNKGEVRARMFHV